MKTCSQIASGLARARVLHAALQASFKINPIKLNYLEIGTAFSEKEGLSTLLAAQFLCENSLDGHVVSIDISADNIQSSKSIIIENNPELLKNITYYCGESASQLSLAINQLQSIDVAFIDGGGDPLVNLHEFLIILDSLSTQGIVVIDDVSFLKTTTYKARRDFGKAQLIYPLLLIADTLKYHIEKIATKNNLPFSDASKILSLNLPSSISALISDHAFIQLCFRLASFVFIKVGTLIVLSKPTLIHDVMQVPRDTNLSNVHHDMLAVLNLHSL